MAVIYVKEQGSVVRKRGGRILVEKDHEVLLEIPLRQTGSVAVFGNVQVTTQALSELLDRDIPLALYTRNGRLKGHLVPETNKNLPLRLAQYKAALSDDTGASLSIARNIVSSKLRNSATLIASYRSHYPSEALGNACECLCRSATHAATALSLSELLGFEGSGAASYFQAFAQMNRSDLPFTGRERHPPPDPMNALLSLGYTMVMNEIRSLLEGAGLDPYLGFLHRPDYGRPSLALDLLEPFRAPIVDRLTLRLVNERVFTEEDFARRVTGGLAGSVILMPESLRKYLEHYEQAMTESRSAAPTGVRTAIESDVEKLAHALRTQGEFVPYQEDTCSM